MLTRQATLKMIREMASSSITTADSNGLTRNKISDREPGVAPLVVKRWMTNARDVIATRLVVRCIAWLGLGEHGVDVQDEPGMEANMFGFAPPALATRRSEQRIQERSTCRFESPLREDSALRSVPNVKSRPGIFLQHLLQSKLIGCVQRALPMKTRGHQLRYVAMLGDGHTDHGPLLHGRVVFVPLEGSRILFDL